MSRPAVACENTRTEGPAQWRKSLDQRAVGSIRPRADPGEQSVIDSTGNARDSASSPIYTIGRKAILIAPEMRNLVNLPSRLSQRRSSGIAVASHTLSDPASPGCVAHLQSMLITISVKCDRPKIEPTALSVTSPVVRPHERGDVLSYE